MSAAFPLEKTQSAENCFSEAGAGSRPGPWGCPVAPHVRRSLGSLPGWAPAPAPQVKPAVHPMFVRPWEEGAAGAEVPERLVAMETGRLLHTGVVAVSGEPQLLSPRGQPCTWADAAGGRPGPQAIPGVPPGSPLDVRSPGGLKVTGGCASPAGRLHPHEGLSESRCPLGGTSGSLCPRGRGPPREAQASQWGS